MIRIINLSVLLVGVLSTLMCFNAQADETSTTTVNPVTQESTTTTVNTDTQQATITKTNPVTGESSTTIIQTPVPAPQEVVVVPSGYANCFMVSAGWYQDTWVPEHKVCQYTSGEGSAWVDGHWVCTKSKASEGVCTEWKWKAGHWVKTFDVY
jgi:hypothetical protein